MPEFPSVPQDNYVPTIITVQAQAEILEAIPWEKRGVFCAMAHTLRPGEARALEIRDYQGGDLMVRRAVKGRKAGSEVRTAKERNWRIVAVDERLEVWLDWRLAQFPKRELLQGTGRLFVNPDGRDPERRWGHDALEHVWKAACKAVGVEVGLYEGTKHATASDLVRRGENMDLVQKFLGHADRRSTERYARLEERDAVETLSEILPIGRVRRQPAPDDLSGLRQRKMRIGGTFSGSTVTSGSPAIWRPRTATRSRNW